MAIRIPFGSSQFPPFPQKCSTISLISFPSKRCETIIRMGGGPRTFPGGVSKWQWKRMQAKKAKQLLRARLAREREIYEMRKRAELRAAVSELERPWEPVPAAPNLFSVSADEQLKVLADRFQKPGGIDLWTERDGPQLFATPSGTPSARFFPKGVVYSVRPYGKISNSSSVDSGSDSEEDDLENKQGSRRTDVTSSNNSVERRSSSPVDKRGFQRSNGKHNSYRKRRPPNDSMGSSDDVYDMRMEDDGSYRFQI